MSPEEAEDLAFRVLAAIDYAQTRWRNAPEMLRDFPAADRERIASDLVALAGVAPFLNGTGSLAAMARLVTEWASDNLRRTAALYGITP